MHYKEALKIITKKETEYAVNGCIELDDYFLFSFRSKDQDAESSTGIVGKAVSKKTGAISAMSLMDYRVLNSKLRRGINNE